MVGAAQRRLDVAQNCIHPSKLGALDRGSPAAHHHRLVNTARRGDAMKAGQPIGDDPSACTEVVLRPGGDFGETEALDDGELHAQRVSLLVGLDGGDKGRLAGRATTAFAPTSLATEIGVIELDLPAERVLAVALHHHLRIPVQPDHRIRRKPITDSDSTRSLIPDEPDHRFRCQADHFFAAAGIVQGVWCEGARGAG